MLELGGTSECGCARLLHRIKNPSRSPNGLYKPDIEQEISFDPGLGRDAWLRSARRILVKKRRKRPLEPPQIINLWEGPTQRCNLVRGLKAIRKVLNGRGYTVAIVPMQVATGEETSYAILMPLPPDIRRNQENESIGRQELKDDVWDETPLGTVVDDRYLLIAKARTVVNWTSGSCCGPTSPVSKTSLIVPDRTEIAWFHYCYCDEYLSKQIILGDPNWCHHLTTAGERLKRQVAPASFPGNAAMQVETRVGNDVWRTTATDLFINRNTPSKKVVLVDHDFRVYGWSERISPFLLLDDFVSLGGRSSTVNDHRSLLCSMTQRLNSVEPDLNVFNAAMPRAA
jgi:hypothetical protein